ncbi:MAG: kynureninase, partial [Flavobacteriales bacterium]
MNQITTKYSPEKSFPLKHYRDKFHIPKDSNGNEKIYFCGNSLGLQPKTARSYIEQELRDWETMGVEGHLHAKTPWLYYHDHLTEKMANVVGAKQNEIAIMNSLTVNLHLMMVSFYRPTNKRYKILIEQNTFPSDQYALKAQAQYHGFNPEDTVKELKPREGEEIIRTEDILEKLNKEGDEIALILLGGVNYYTGQAFEMEKITEKGKEKGCMVGYDLAHAAGNLHMNLHDWNVDFAVWCTYKYLNAGPGGIAGCFVHEKYAEDFDLPRFPGWFGHEKETRFLMRPDFKPIKGAEGWQLSNPPIFQMAALNASLEIFEMAGISNLSEKSKKLTGYLEYLLKEIQNEQIQIITPKNPN